MVKRIFLTSFGVFLLLLAGSATVLAISQPDGDLSITDIHVNRHLLEPNDFFIYGIYDIPYDTAPDEPVCNTFIFRLKDTDGTTQLGCYLAYPYASHGYGKGGFQFYFGNATAPTWGEQYRIQIIGNPAYFEDPPSNTFVVSASDYSIIGTRDGNRSEVSDRIISIAGKLEVAWNTTLLDQTDTGTVLSSSGEAYFRNAMPCLQGMAPELFLVEVGDPDYDERTWDTTQATTYEQRMMGTDVGAGIGGLSTLLSVDFHMIASIPIIVFCVVLVTISIKQSNTAYSGFLNAIVVLICGAVMGWTPWAILSIITLLCIIFAGYHIFLRGST